MSNSNFQFNATLGGIAFSVLPWMNWDLFVQTVVLAAIGALTSIGVTLGYKWLVHLWQNLKLR